MSLEKDDAVEFVKTIRKFEIMMGSSEKKIDKALKIKRLNIRRSVYLLEDVKKGQIFKNSKFEFKIPGYGISPDKYDLYKNKKFKFNLKKKHNLKITDLK